MLQAGALSFPQQPESTGPKTRRGRLTSLSLSDCCLVPLFLNSLLSPPVCVTYTLMIDTLTSLEVDVSETIYLMVTRFRGDDSVLPQTLGSERTFF